MESNNADKRFNPENSVRNEGAAASADPMNNVNKPFDLIAANELHA